MWMNGCVAFSDKGTPKCWDKNLSQCHTFHPHSPKLLCCSVYCLFCVVLYIVCFVSFCVLFVCECVLYYCHRVTTQLQLINIYHIISHINWPDTEPGPPRWDNTVLNLQLAFVFIVMMDILVKYTAVFIKSERWSHTSKTPYLIFGALLNVLGAGHQWTKQRASSIFWTSYTAVNIQTVAW